MTDDRLERIRAQFGDTKTDGSIGAGIVRELLAEVDRLRTLLQRGERMIDY